MSFSFANLKLFQQNKILYPSVLFCGSLSLLAYSPFAIWFLMPLLLTFVFFMLDSKSLWQSFVIGWMFGCGIFLTEAISIREAYVRLYQDGTVNAILAFTPVFLVPVYYGFCCTLFTALRTRWAVLNSLLLWPSCWVLAEALRSHLLGGFPFLLVGLISVDSWFKHLVPLVGMLGMTFFWVSCSGAFNLMIRANVRRREFLAGFVWLLFWVAVNILASSWHFTYPVGEKIPVVAIQGNMDYSKKTTTNYYVFQRYVEMSLPLIMQGTPLIILPESSASSDEKYYKGQAEQLEKINALMQKTGSSLLVGSLYAHHDILHSVAYLFGLNNGRYEKIHLLPFGDYSIKLPNAKREYISTKQGSMSQSLMPFGSYKFNAMICYDAFFSDIVRRQLSKANWFVALVNNNDFVGSIEPWQHQQSARFFALATGREYVMATNDAVTSWISVDGNVKVQLPMHKEGTLSINIQPYEGLTPWGRWGDMPILLISAFILVVSWLTKTVPKQS